MGDRINHGVNLNGKKIKWGGEMYEKLVIISGWIEGGPKRVSV